jgi:hypothetical protein
MTTTTSKTGKSGLHVVEDAVGICCYRFKGKGNKGSGLDAAYTQTGRYEDERIMKLWDVGWEGVCTALHRRWVILSSWRLFAGLFGTFVVNGVEKRDV